MHGRVCIPRCTHAHTHARVHTDAYICVHVHTVTCMHIHSCICMCTQTYPYSHLYTLIHKHKCIHVHTSTYIHTRAHPHTHTQISTHTQLMHMDTSTHTGIRICSHACVHTQLPLSDQGKPENCLHTCRGHSPEHLQNLPRGSNTGQTAYGPSSLHSPGFVVLHPQESHP